MNNINIRTIINKESLSEIAHKNYVIKDYQRGYRWTEKQIIDLLDDINEFDSTDEKKYCLQPLIVKRIESSEKFITLNDVMANSIVHIGGLSNNDYNEVYELIDGQQRLTTILLIYSICYENLIKKPNLPYNIMYQYIRNIDETYMQSAIVTIDKWFEHFGDLIDDKKEEIRKKLNSDVIFIWYEIDKSIISNEVFSKINEGKIPLNSSDLFKAVLLNSIDKIDSNQGVLISKEWDEIESKLNDDNFWYFISNKDIDRMDYLLTIYSNMKDNDRLINMEDNLYSYYVISSLIKNGKKPNEIWEEIVNIFNKLLYWFKDKELYHLIGFLIVCCSYNKKQESHKIVDLIKETANMTKQDVKSVIYKKIKKEIGNVDFDNINYYSGNDVRKVLLYFNIKSIIKSKTDNKFSFENFKKMKWDIEHIHAVANEEKLKSIIDINERVKILTKLKNTFEELGISEKVEYIEKAIIGINENTSIDTFVKVYKSIIGNEIVDENFIGNLTLLDQSTNREYQNELYAYKRKVIINKDKENLFIPLCTKNVFLKYYSVDPKTLITWANDDANDYANCIKSILMEDGLCK